MRGSELLCHASPVPARAEQHQDGKAVSASATASLSAVFQFSVSRQMTDANRDRQYPSTIECAAIDRTAVIACSGRSSDVQSWLHRSTILTLACIVACRMCLALLI